MLDKYTTSLGKFDSPMAEYVWSEYLLNGSFGDEDCSHDWSGDWANRYGRRILFGDDRGFVYLAKFDTEAEAESAFFEWDEPFHVEDDDDDEPEVNPYAGPGGLLDEIKQAERLLGTE